MSLLFDIERPLRSELVKFVPSRTMSGVLATTVALVAFAMAVHVLGLPAADLSSGGRQLALMIDVTANLGSVFAGLAGALLITSEFRTGTSRWTFLATPRRHRVLLAKGVLALALGAAAGVLAAGTAVLVEQLGLVARGLDPQLAGGDVARAVAGAGGGAALWGAIGLAVGTIVRAQVPTIIGLLTWVLFVESVLVEVPALHELAPAAMVAALAGQDRDGVLTTAAGAGVLLAAYAAVAGVAAVVRLSRADLA